jgi:hypothetical protein
MSYRTDIRQIRRWLRKKETSATPATTASSTFGRKRRNRKKRKAVERTFVWKARRSAMSMSAPLNAATTSAAAWASEAAFVTFTAALSSATLACTLSDLERVVGEAWSRSGGSHIDRHFRSSGDFLAVAGKVSFPPRDRDSPALLNNRGGKVCLSCLPRETFPTLGKVGKVSGKVSSEHLRKLLFVP